MEDSLLYSELVNLNINLIPKQLLRNTEVKYLTKYLGTMVQPIWYTTLTSLWSHEGFSPISNASPVVYLYILYHYEATHLNNHCKQSAT